MRTTVARWWVIITTKSFRRVSQNTSMPMLLM